MDLSSVIQNINKNRERIEAPFVMSLWKNPELYDNYPVLTGDDLVSEDALFYYNLGKALYDKGYKVFDSMTVYSFLEDKKEVRTMFEEMGGYREVESLKSLVKEENIETHYDNIVKSNMLCKYAEKMFGAFSKIEMFNGMTSGGVYDYFDYQINNISLNSTVDVEIDSMDIDDAFIAECNSGDTQGISYAKNCPILNYLTLGVPIENLFMIGGFSGVGKTSFAFENMVIPMCLDGEKILIASNEQRAKDYKILLLVHILTHDLDYWGLTRKQIKMGKFNSEQMEMIRQAQKIRREKYGTITFAKLFDNDVKKLKKVIKKYAKLGHRVVIYDTMKSENEIDEAMWQSLLMNSREIFSLADREHIAIIPTYQLALSKLNQRYLNAGCLSNAKQIKEVFSEMIYLRELWQDEYNSEKYDCKPYQFEKDANGKYTKVKKFIPLNKDKKYIVVFLDKTRNDENNVQILYEVNGRFNLWKEVGYCTITNSHE